MEIISLISDNYRSNTYLVASDNKCYIIDPGMPSETIINAISDHGLTPIGILLTHGHFDHIFSLDDLREFYKIPVYIHENDAEMLTDSEKNAYSLFFGGSFTAKKPENLLNDGDTLKVGNEQLTVRHTPGHSRGSCCYLSEKIIITGDTLFSCGIGRTDLYGGNGPELFKNLFLLREIPGAKDLTIYPGHGNSATLSDALDNSIY